MRRFHKFTSSGYGSFSSLDWEWKFVLEAYLWVSITKVMIINLSYAYIEETNIYVMLALS